VPGTEDYFIIAKSSMDVHPMIPIVSLSFNMKHECFGTTVMVNQQTFTHTYKVTEPLVDLQLESLFFTVTDLASNLNCLLFEMRDQSNT
jgi:hypothetical protein